MKTLLHLVAAAYTAALVSIAAPQAALGSDRKIQIPSQKGVADDAIIWAQAQTQKKSRSSEASSKPKLNVDSSGVILNGYDAVAYFAENKAVKGSSKYQSTYQGAIYYFSSAANLTTFKKSPSKYVPQYGGFCANGVKNGKLTDVDPTMFFIVKGKLYCCESSAATKDFRTHEDEDIVTANRNWEQLKH